MSLLPGWCRRFAQLAVLSWGRNRRHHGPARSQFTCRDAKCRATEHGPGFACYRRKHILAATYASARITMKRRDFLMIAAAGSLLPQTVARGQGAWPQRNITILVPFLAGGST